MEAAMNKSSSKQETFDSQTLATINDAVCSRIEELFQLLEIDLQKQGRCYLGCCPVHGGNNPTACNVYPEGYTVPGYWRCNSKKCHTKFAANIIGFTRGVLSHRKYGWQQKGDKQVGFDATINFLMKFIGKELKINYEAIDKKKFCQEVQMYAKPKPKEQAGVNRNLVRSYLNIPAKEYLNRGYSGEILNKYDVGTFKSDVSHKLKDRIIVPVYDDKFMLVGVQGRSIQPLCKKCELYHNPNHQCPSKEYEPLFVKWRNGDGFTCGYHLYNMWYAKPHIQDTRSIILVEGPGDVWRLEEAGIHNAVALMGGNFTEQQEILVETSGATTVVILTDNDKAGNEAAEIIKKKCERLYNVIRPTLATKDLGEMDVGSIQTTILPILKKAERRF